MKYKCIIFDCDGVLVDSEPIAHQVMVDLANSYGANIDYEYAHSRFSGGFLQQAIDHIQTLIDKPLPQNFIQEYRRITFKRFQKNIKAVEGIESLLKKISVPICVASNGPRNKMEITLGVTGLLTYFKGHIFSAYDLNAWKPDPKLFIHAAKTMGFFPNDCLVIEDSLSGVQAGISGGFDVFALTNEQNKVKLENAGAQVFLSVKDLEDYLFYR